MRLFDRILLVCGIAMATTFATIPARAAAPAGNISALDPEVWNVLVQALTAKHYFIIEKADTLRSTGEISMALRHYLLDHKDELQPNVPRYHDVDAAMCLLAREGNAAAASFVNSVCALYLRDH